MTKPENTTESTAQTSDQSVVVDDLVDDSLVEEISIDGMCGVY